ncbi:hypothetical protein C8R46DRAFT_1347004 [Mycena filopes]|nr:hypothetical protein C8R46DRAFT_1347004 [Mycena filopes]
MAEQADVTHLGQGQGDKPFLKPDKVFYAYASFAQFCYVASQVAMASYFINHATETQANTSTVTGAQAAGRFSGSAIMTRVRPRWVFLVYLTLTMVSCSAAITERGDTGVGMLVATVIFENVGFPTIVALAIRAIRREIERGSWWLVAGVVGGACWYNVTK